MLLFILFSAFVLPSCPLTGSLTLLQWDPLLFKLSFSEPINLPAFQLLYNNVYNIPYQILTKQYPNSQIMIQGNIQDLPSTSNLQSYDLFFNNPLSVGNGDLQYSNYTLHAAKMPTQVNFPAAIGILLLIGAYFFNMFTEIGKLSIEFTHIYILLMFQNSTTMVLGMYQQLYVGMLLIPPVEVLKQSSMSHQSYIMVCLVLPLVAIYVLALAGYINLKFAPKKRSILANIIYQQLTFNAFIKSTHLFLFNLCYNSISFVFLLKDNTVGFISEIKNVGIALVYFNVITLVAIIYLGYYILNPKLCQTQQSWIKYTRSAQFHSFRQLHDRVQLFPWYKRNYSILKMLKMVILILIFFQGPSVFQYILLLCQFIHIIYTITIRPFKQQFYLNVKVICRLSFFIQYIVIIIGKLYYNMTQASYNYYSAYVYVMVRSALYLAVMFGLFVGVGFEIYFKYDNLTYQIKLVRDDDQFKVQFVERKRNDSESVPESKHTIFSDRRSKGSGKHRRSSMSESPNRRRRSKKSLSRDDQKRGNSPSKVQIEMANIQQILRQGQKAQKVQGQKAQKGQGSSSENNKRRDRLMTGNKQVQWKQPHKLVIENGYTKQE